ncbi:MAG: HAD-IB family phosphatase [Candidatus Aenigmarchaeota archaeon]|nr:HAD-IB family phosphatase [Candidatus Aenigmarchaeota archaeon]
MSNFRVVCFDFDNVIINDSVSRFLSLVGSRIERLKMEIDFLQDNMEPRKFFRFAKKFAEMGKGMNYETVINTMLKKVRLNRGVRRIFRKLKEDGHKIVIVSTNDERFIRRVLEKENLARYVDHIYASHLVVKDGVLTGEIKGDVVKTEKVGAVKKIKNLFKVKENSIVYIGDGLTDLPIMKIVGRSVLFCPNLITKAEVLKDRLLRKMEHDGRLFVVHNGSLMEAMQFV